MRRPLLGPRISLLLPAALLAASLGPVAAGCGGGDEGESDADAAAACLTTKRYFQKEVWSAFMGGTCTKCHTPDGVAVSPEDPNQKPARFVLQPPSYPGFLDANLATLKEMATYSQNGVPLLLQKPLGKLDHGGKVVLTEGSPEMKALTELVDRLNTGRDGGGCGDDGTAAMAGVTNLDGATLVRKAALDLAGRLPTADELAKGATNNDADLDAVLDGLMKEPMFLTRVREMFNDVYLTDKLLSYGGMAVDLMNESSYPGLKPYKDSKTPEYMDTAKRRMINAAIAREPVDLVAYVVRNDRPFTEIVTAPYAIVNPYTAIAYGANVQFSNPTDYEEFREVQVTLGSGVAVPHAGILSTPSFLNRWQTTPTNRNRARSRRVYSFFLATDVLKIAERPIDATKVTEGDNPTRNSVYCNVCHKTLDPVAGAFRGWDDNDYEKFTPDAKWHDEMFEPGFGGDKLPPDQYGAGVKWLGPEIAKDPRFYISAIQIVYKGLTGHEPLRFPSDSQAPDFADATAAWEAQDRFFAKTSEAFKAANTNLKAVVKAVIKSPYYRGVAPAGGGSASRLRDVGTAKLLGPEALDRKIKAVFGVPWIKQYEFEKSHSWLQEDFELLYGGIDSDNVTSRLVSPNGIASSIGWRMATETACHLTAWDFTRPKAERALFTEIEPAEVPEAAGHTVDGGVAAIKANIVKLHDLVLGEKLAASDPEIERTYQVFYGTWKELTDAGAKDDLYWECQGRIDPQTGKELPDAQKVTKDKDRTIRAWQAVVTYLLLDYKFLYH